MTLFCRHDEKKNDLETDFETEYGRCLEVLLSNFLKKISSIPKTCAEVGSKFTEFDYYTLSLCVQPCHICGKLLSEKETTFRLVSASSTAITRNLRRIVRT